MIRTPRMCFSALTGALVATLASEAWAQTASVTLQNASVFREPLYCSGGTDVVACGAGCSWAGAAGAGVVQLSGGITQVTAGIGCTRWTFYASGAQGGTLRRGDRLRLFYELWPLVTPGGTARAAYASIGGSRGGADIVAAGVGPLVLTGDGTRSGQVIRPSFVTDSTGGTWNLEMAVEWQPIAGATFSLQIPPAGFRVEVLESSCPADVDGDGTVTPADISAFVNRWLSSLTGGGLDGDFDGNGAIEPADVAAFVAAWLGAVSGGCS